MLQPQLGNRILSGLRQSFHLERSRSDSKNIKGEKGLGGKEINCIPVENKEEESQNPYFVVFSWETHCRFSQKWNWFFSPNLYFLKSLSFYNRGTYLKWEINLLVSLQTFLLIHYFGTFQKKDQNGVIRILRFLSFWNEINIQKYHFSLCGTAVCLTS